MNHALQKNRQPYQTADNGGLNASGGDFPPALADVFNCYFSDKTSSEKLPDSFLQDMQPLAWSTIAPTCSTR
jgi:hypothetical protein